MSIIYLLVLHFEISFNDKIRMPECSGKSARMGYGDGGGQVVSVLSFNYDDPKSNLKGVI